jgi:glycosyltransferase involved in cell wall biosynthesis
MGFVLPISHGGQVRSMAQLRVLCSLPEVQRIRLFSVWEKEVGRELSDALIRDLPKLEIPEPVFHPIHLFRHPRYVPRVVWLRAIHRVPYVAGKWDSPTIRKALRRELAGGTFEVVWLNGLASAHYLPMVRRLQPGARVVLDQHNVESDRFAQFARRQRGVRRIVAEAEWRAARDFERDVLQAVDSVGAISQHDARAYRDLAGIEARTVPQVASFTRRTGEGSGPRLCWFGSLTWNPNVRGLNWFCREVWPRVRERLPEATLEIAGPGLPTAADGSVIAPSAWRRPGITILGFVDSISPLCARSVAMVAPVLGGTGIRLKLIDAFREGIPAVTTPDGAGGLDIEPGREAFVEEDPLAFAARVVELATSENRRASFREAGYAFLEKHHRFEVAQAAVRDLLGLAPVPEQPSEPDPLPVAGSDATPLTRRPTPLQRAAGILGA